MAEPTLVVRDLTTEYRSGSGTVRAVDAVTFAVEPGTTLGLVGESGCGKSATALSITRMIPETAGRIVSGSVVLNGVDLMKLRREELRRVRGNQIGFVPQDPLSSLSPLMPVGRQVAEVLREHRGLGRSAARDKAARLLDRVGIPRARERLDDYPHQLSGGLRQRVAIAMAISCDPVLLIADEPTTALDVTTQAQILELLKELAAGAAQMATVLITHDLGVAAHMCDSIRVMYAGQIVESADVDTFFAEPATPYARGLMKALPSAPSSDDDGRLVAIPGAPPSLSQTFAGCRFSTRCAYARDRCRLEVPELTPRQPGSHFARCWGTETTGWIT
jgi:oligopeptide/dipeptide ABC transporter ATP-binding protein